MHQQFGNEAGKEVLEKTPGKAEIGPVMSVLQDIKSIPLEINLAIEVLLVESLHGNLALAMIFGTVMFAVELQVVLNRAARVLGFLVLARRHGGGHAPEGYQDWNGREEGKEDGGIKPRSHLASKVPRNKHQQSDQQGSGEAVTAGGVCRKGSIFDGGVLSRD